MRIPKNSHSASIEVKKSRFIAIAQPVSSIQEIGLCIANTRAAHPKASHVVHAAVLGNKGSQWSMSDDHEPKNSAGRAALEVLKASGITNILVMVIRYFGGTLLGTGPLAKAYKDAVKAALDGLETEELVDKTSFSVTLGYDMYDSVQRILLRHHAELSESFATDIRIVAVVPSSEFELLACEIGDATKGKVNIAVD